MRFANYTNVRVNMKLAIIFLFTLLSACATCDFEKGPISFTKFEADLYEALFRYAFKNNASAAQGRADFYSLTVDWRDPNEEFMGRFNSDEKMIIPDSKTKFSCDKGVYIEGEEKKGISFEVNNLQFEAPNKAKVSWTYQEGCLSSAISDAVLEFMDGKWVVIDSKIIIISRINPNNQPQPTGSAVG